MVEGVLRNIGQPRVGVLPDSALLRLHLPRQQLDQRRLARPVRLHSINEKRLSLQGLLSNAMQAWSTRDNAMALKRATVGRNSISSSDNITA